MSGHWRKYSGGHWFLGKTGAQEELLNNRYNPSQVPMHDGKLACR